jgi:hypothetical protein
LFSVFLDQFQEKSLSIRRIGAIQYRFKAVISSSYEGKTIFRASVPFLPADQPLLHEKDVDPNDFAALDASKLEINQNWKTLFNLAASE